jgi:hypothetical protein
MLFSPGDFSTPQSLDFPVFTGHTCVVCGHGFSPFSRCLSFQRFVEYVRKEASGSSFFFSQAKQVINRTLPDVGRDQLISRDDRM